MTYQEQLEAVQWELTQGPEKRAGDRIRRAKTASEAGDITSRHYERPLAANKDAATRANTAERISQSHVPGRRPDEGPHPPPGDVPQGAPPKTSSPTAPGRTPGKTSDAPAAAPSNQDLPSGSKLAPNGQPPKAFVVHHTGSRASAAANVNFWRNQGKGIGTQ